MTYWTTAFTDIRAITAIFGDSAPPLTDVDLHEVLLHRDGPAVSLRFDLSTFPSPPPKKWANCNTVQMTVTAVDTYDVRISGLSRNMPGAIVIEGNALSFTGGEMSITLKAKHFAIQKVSAYLKTN